MSEPAGDRPHAGGTDLLTQALEEAQQTYQDAPLTGHPAAEPPVDAPPEPTPSPPGDTGTPGPTPPASPEPPAPRLKYTSHEEAERAELAATRRMHEAVQEAAEWRKRVERLEQQVQERPAVPEPVKTPEPTPVPAFDAKAHIAKAYQRMSELDPTSEEYEARQQAIFTEALGEAFEHYATHTTLSQAQIDQRIHDTARAVAQEAVTASLQQRDAATHVADLRTRLLRSATEAGLDVREPSDTDRFGGRHYADLMYAVDNGVYPSDATEDAAIAAVVDVVRERWGLTTPPAAPGTQAPATVSSPAPASAAPFVPMERGSAGQPVPQPDVFAQRGMSLNELVERSMTMRRP